MSVPSPPRFDESGIRPFCSDQALEFYWGPPASADQTGYTLSCPTDPSSPYTFAANVGYTKITGLTNGQEYAYQIVATNGNGSSAPAFYTSVEPGLTPGAPITPSIVFQNTSTVRVSFTPAASNGGATIKWYVADAVSSDPVDPVVSYDCRGIDSNIYITGLNTASFYNFYVSAVNDPGYSQQISTGVIYNHIVKKDLLLDLESSNFSQGSTWADSSSNGNNATLETGIGQKIGNYVYFDGSTNFTAPSVGNLSNWTIAAWYMPLAPINSYAGIINAGVKYNNDRGIINYHLGAATQSNVYGGGFATSDTGAILTNFSLDLNTWNYITTTFDGTNIISYLSSSVVSSRIQIPPYPLLAADYMYIGKGSPSYGGIKIKGLLGEALIYNRVLSAQEISINYNITSNYYKNGILQNGLLLRLESSNYSGGSSWLDSSSNGNNATLGYGTGQTQDGYVYFNGSTYFTAPNLGTLSNWTLTLWYNSFVDYNASGFIILGESYGTGGPSYSIIYSPNGFGAAPPGYVGFAINSVTGTQQYTAGTQLVNNTWNNLVVTYDNSYMRMYLNNVLLSSNAASGLLQTNGQPIAIGGGGGFSGRINGLLGQALIYNRALSAKEISYNYNLTAPSYNMRIIQDGILLQLESSNYSGGSTWLDSSSNGNNATLAAGTGQTSNGYTYFDGSSYFITLQLGALSNLTLSIWIQPFVTPSGPTWIVGQEFSPPFFAIVAGGFAGGPSGYAGYTWGSINVQYNTEGLELVNNTWNNLVLTYDGEYMSIFLNNIFTSRIAASGITSANHPFRIGGGDSYPYRINGLVGEVLIYNRALSPQEILYNYSLTAPTYA